MQLLEILQEIGSKVKIESSNFSVIHPGLNQQKIPTNVLEKLKKLPEKVQDEYIVLLLQKLIFSIYYSGNSLLNKNQVIDTDYKIGLESSSSEVDWEFCDKLDYNNHGKGSWNPNFRILREEADGSIAVEKKGTIVYIQRGAHLRLEEQSAQIGDLVSLPRPSSHMKNQFYIAYGDLVYTWRHPSVYIYFNFSPEGAVSLMGHLTEKLNAIKIPFDFNVLYNPSNYGRYDSGILRIYKESYQVIRQVLETVYTENESHFQPHVPIFTKVLAPGLALGERPEKEFKFLEDFGMNRCKIIAYALLEAHKNSDESPEARMKYIFEHFEYMRIDLEHSYLNPNSEDIYTPVALK